MFGRKFSRFCIAVSVLLCASFGFSQNAGRQPGSVDKFVANLTGDNKVIEGFGMRLNPGDLCCRGILPSAIYFNKTAPYATFAVQPVQSPLIDFDEIPVFQLAPDEAIVLIGVTPPEAKFFSYQPYLLMRFFPPDPKPKAIFASLGDTINVSTVKTIGPDPFNKPVVLIFTPDQGTDARLRAALHSAGYPDAIINTLPFPAHMLNLGLDPKSNDYFILGQRTAMFTNEAAGQAYIDAMSNSDVTKRSVRVFRVTPTVSGALQPFPAPPLRIRGTGHSEVDLTPALNQLRDAIVSYWDSQGYKVAGEYHTRNLAYDGNEYIGRQKNLLGDSRDSFYMAAGYEPMFDLQDKLTLDKGDFLVAYGPNHVATGKATYTNINVYSQQAMFPLATIYSDQFPGSVESYRSYLGADFPAGLMYAIQLARPSECRFEVCLRLNDPPIPCKPRCDTPPCPQLEFDASTLLGVYFRNYLEPPTGVGPAASEILYDQLIKFSPK